MWPIEKCFPHLHRMLRENPMAVVDAGCAGGIDPIFNDLARQGYADNFGFEASPKEYEKLAAMAKDPAVRMTIHNLALLDRDGTITFNACGTVGSVFARNDRVALYRETYEALEVPCATLDSLRANGTISRPIGVLKLDVEGSELAVLRGARETMAREVLCVKAEMEFHAARGTNNFAEIHLALGEAGFRLQGLAYNHSAIDGLHAGDALYLRRPEAVVAMPSLTNEEKRLWLLWLAAICLNLRQGEYLAVIARVGAGLFSPEEEAELRDLAVVHCFLPNVLPFAFPRLAHLVFVVAQFVAGKKHGTKSAPKVNRLVPLKPLFVQSHWQWLRRRHEQYLARKVKAYMTRADLKR
ncbi:MAG: FkbM family methyltransferase [Thermodesulfobacteriota bacterium]